MTKTSNESNMMERLSLRELAEELDCRAQSLFKISNRLGIETIKQRDPDRGNQLVSTVSKSDANKLRVEFLTRSKSSSATGSDFESPDDGLFYVVQLEPELDPGRVKVGFTTDIPSRIRKHRCAAPFANCVKTWTCKRAWERAAIDCVSEGLEQLHTEVFRGKIDEIISRADSFFSVMPTVTLKSDDSEP